MIDKNRSSFLMSFLDMVFAMLLAVSSLLLLNYILIVASKDAAKKIDSKAEILITMTWDDHSANDIDLWVLTPEMGKIGYPNKQNTYMGLERDDLGLSNDTTLQNPDEAPTKEDQLIYKNIETVAIRALHPGHYIVNVQWYDVKPNPITGKTKEENEQTEVQLMRINPTFKLAAVSKPILLKKQDEQTAFSFDITDDGQIANITYDQEHFIYQDINPTDSGLDANED